MFKSKKDMRSLQKYYAKRLTKRYKRKMRNSFIFRTIVKCFLVSSILALALGSVQVSSEAIQVSWGFPEAEARDIGVYEARMQVRNRILAIAKDRDFKYPDYAVRIACCESKLGTYTENIKNNNPSSSKDRGLYMVNDYYHPEISDACTEDLACATNFFMDMVEKNRQHEWVCDRHVKGNKNYTATHCGI